MIKSKKRKKKNEIPLFIGRFSPPHKGHILVILWLLSKYQYIVIGIGSCYEIGKPNQPLLAFQRQKMIELSLIKEGIDLSRIKFVHIPDYNNWDVWWDDIVCISSKYRVTHFVTGNEEMILNVIKEKNIKMPFKIINPEKELPKKFQFKYHATQLREAYFKGDKKMFKLISSFGANLLMGSVSGAVIDAMSNKSPDYFVPGRQTVDIVMTCDSRRGTMLVCGYRRKGKEFAGHGAIPGGGINKFENPLDAAIREFTQETGIKIEIINRYTEPALVLVNKTYFAEMRFIGLFSSKEKKLGGKRGGSSQVFHIHLTNVKAVDLNKIIRSNSDLRNVKAKLAKNMLRKGLAYQHNRMVTKALNILGIG